MDMGLSPDRIVISKQTTGKLIHPVPTWIDRSKGQVHFYSGRRTPEVTSDEYHRFLEFLILDLHKSQVGPSKWVLQIFFKHFLFKNEKKKN